MAKESDLQAAVKQVIFGPVPENVEPPLHQLGELQVLEALRIAKEGKIFSLDAGRWNGMPLFSGHPQFQIKTFRTPAGIRLAGDDEPYKPNDANQLWLSEVISGTAHTGTHIDALCHITRGPDDCFFGNKPYRDHVGDFGSNTADACAIPPIIARGVMVDIPRIKGVDALPGGYEISREDIECAVERQSIELREGDVVFARTGLMHFWPDEAKMHPHLGAGLGLEAALMLAEAGAVAVGTDSETVECFPTQVPGCPSPVHCALLVDRGIYILEWVFLEELSNSKVYEFLLICAPLKVRGATGSMLRPLAIV